MRDASIAAALALALVTGPLRADQPPPFPDFTFKRVTPPDLPPETSRTLM